MRFPTHAVTLTDIKIETSKPFDPIVFTCPPSFVYCAQSVRMIDIKTYKSINLPNPSLKIYTKV